MSGGDHLSEFYDQENPRIASMATAQAWRDRLPAVRAGVTFFADVPPDAQERIPPGSGVENSTA